MSILSEFVKQNVNVQTIAKKALEDNELLAELLQGLLSKKDEIRFGCFQVLLLLSEQHPALLNPQWDYFEKLLGDSNNYRQYIAIALLASLAREDEENRFNAIFEKYFGILGGERMVVSAAVATNAGKIARAKPRLQGRITAKLLNIDEDHKGKQKELIKSYAIESLSEYYSEIEDKQPVLEFVRQQLKNSSPRTRKKAREFLERWAGPPAAQAGE